MSQSSVRGARGQSSLSTSPIRPPRYPIRPHATGQAMVWVWRDGRRRARYLGVWGTPASHAAYRQLVAAWPQETTSHPTPERSR